MTFPNWKSINLVAWSKAESVEKGICALICLIDTESESLAHLTTLVS